MSMRTPFYLVFTLITFFSFTSLSADNYKIVDLGEGYGYEDEINYHLNDHRQIAAVREDEKNEDIERVYLYDRKNGWKHLSDIKTTSEYDDRVTVNIHNFTNSGIILGNLSGYFEPVDGGEPDIVINDIPYYSCPVYPQDIPFVYYPDHGFVDLSKEFSHQGISISYHAFEEDSVLLNENGLAAGLVELNGEDHKTIFTFTPENGVRLLEYPLNESQGPYELRSINNKGQILFQDEGDEGDYYLYDQKEGFISLGKFGLKEKLDNLITKGHNSGDPITATMNDNGMIVGTVTADYDGDWDYTVFVYSPENSTHILPIKNYHKNDPFVLTKDNRIVVSGMRWEGEDELEEVFKTFIWSEEGGLQELVDWRKYSLMEVDEDDGEVTYDYPSQIKIFVNDQGKVLIFGTIENEEEDEELFLWDSKNGLRFLKDLVGKAGKKWVFNHISDPNKQSNNHGEILIEGIENTEEEEEHILLLVPSK